MKSFIFFGALVFLAPVSPAIAANDQPSQTPDEIKARELVQSLGNPRFKIREDAARQLLQMGRIAKNALIEGKKSSDPEIWNRCSQLLPMALEQDLKARVDAFLADKEGKQKHDLPYWSRFQKVAGNDAGARKLYSDIVRTNATLLDQSEEGPEMAGEKYNIRAQEMQFTLNMGWRKGQQPIIAIPDIAALFLIGSDADASKHISNTPFNPVSSFLWQANIQQALRTGEQSNAFRKLMMSWAEHRDDANSVSQVLSLVQSLNLKEGLNFAIKAMQMKDQQVWTRAQAVTCVGKMGNKDNAGSFDNMLGDVTVVGNLQLNNGQNNIMITTHMGDVALAMSLHLTGLNPKDYGYDILQTQPNALWTYHWLGFSSDAKRNAALVKAAGAKDLLASTRGAALLAVMHHCKEEDYSLIAPFLKENVVVGSTMVDGKKLDVELRDIALAVGAIITKQDLGEYGYKVANKEKPKDAQVKEFYFTSNDQREAALKKWHQWVEKQPKK
jgi:hypothetical protein